MNELKKKLLTSKRHMEKVEVPDLGLSIYLRRMNGIERDEFMSAQAQAQKDEKDKGLAAFLALQPKIVALTACDEDGDLIFESPEEVRELDGLLIETLSRKALEVNGMTKESRDAIEKKVSPTTGSGST